MLKETKSFSANLLIDANTYWFDCPDATPLDEDVKNFAKFVCRVFELPTAALDVAEYSRIVQNKTFLDLLGERALPEDSETVDAYRAAAPSNLKFYVSHSVLCLAGRLQVVNQSRSSRKNG